MTDLRTRFEAFEDVPVPDLWDRVEALATTTPVTSPRRAAPRFVVAAAAAIAVLLLIGGPFLVGALRESTGVADEEAAKAPTGSVVWDTTAWEMAPVAGPWEHALIDVERSPDGGVVVATADSGVAWTPDGIDWFDADPAGRLTTLQRPTADESQPSNQRAMAVTESRVAILDQALPGVWLGDPATGEWTPIVLAEGEGSRVELLTIAANSTTVLVVTRHLAPDGILIQDNEGEVESRALPVTDRYRAWTIDPAARTAAPNPLPLPVPEAASLADAVVEWFHDQWVMVSARNVWTGEDEGWASRTALLTSNNGATWTAGRPPEEWNGAGFTSLSAGPTTMIATTCHFGGDTFWVTTNGSDWEPTTSRHLGHQSTYVEGVGFVVPHHTPGEASGFVSPDGRTWDESVQLEPYRGDVERLATTDGGLIAINNDLLLWSRDR